MAKDKLASPQETYDCALKNNGSVRAVARELGMSRGAVKYRLELAAKMGFVLDKPTSGGKLVAAKARTLPLPKPGQIKRYILTSAQNNTDAHVPFFENLVAYAEMLDAEVFVGSFSYNRAAFSQKSTKRGRGPTEDDRREDWYDPIFEPYFMDEPLELAPMLEWRGELNIIPTAKRPLSSLETYTKLRSGIFPHCTFALASVAVTADDGAKMNYTTGAATMLNFVQKKTGLEAEFHHSYGALIVEVDHEGDWHVRQLNADPNGSFYDIAEMGTTGAVYVDGGLVTAGVDVEAVNWGDLHARVIDPEIRDIAFSEGGILDTLRPRHQFAHDILDFRARNHHEIKNHHRMFLRHVEGVDNVAREIENVKELLDTMHRDFALTVVVDSNHDRALERWLQESDYKKDPVNAVFFLECELDWHKRKAADPECDYHHLREALRRCGVSKDVLFLGPDDSFVLCDDGGGGIECGMHGHLGPNGSRGTPLNLSKMGRRANTGHTHSACIMDGLYVAGTFSRLRLDYNKGPSSWSHSLIVTYPNGKRCIVTIYNGKWRGTSFS